MPMGMADIAEVLWNDFLKHNPNNPFWPNRDRFVLSNGHGSMLLYSVLHLSGYNLSIDDLKNFRQFDSKTPGHPELDLDIGIETTTGPLGQGIANALAMILCTAMLLRHSCGLEEEAQAVEQAVADVIDAGLRSPDLGGELGTVAMAEEVLARLGD